MEVKMHTLKEAIKESIKEAIEDDLYDDIEDGLHEIVDSHMPIYTYEIIEYALDDISLAVTEPETYAFDGKHNAVNAILGNIYDEQYHSAILSYAQIIEDIKKEKENEHK